jgi:peroxiredoxin
MRINRKQAVQKIFLLWILAVVTAGLYAQPSLWKAQLSRNDGNTIPFSFEWKMEHGKPVWIIRNATERIKVTDITVTGDSIFVQMPVFESQFRVKKINDGLEGVWIKGGAVRTTVLPFNAKPGDKRFTKAAKNHQNISGRWAVSFANSKTNERSVAEFQQSGNRLTGTFLNASGDYRYLEGMVSGDSLFLSGFDGSHSFLFTAAITSADKISGGIFYSGAIYKEAWTAIKDPAAKVPQESVAMYVKPGEEKLHFSFRSLEGNTVSINDGRFKNKVVVIQLMGSWCPNCMDETAFLSEYYNKNRHRGVEVIALAYEYSSNWERSSKSLQKFKDRYDVQYTILNTEVTVTDSLRTEKTLPELTPIKFFPSSIILDKKGKIRKLDTGFNGPATGIHHIQYKKEFEETIDALLAE